MKRREFLEEECDSIGDASLQDSLLRESAVSTNEMRTEDVATPASICCLQWQPTHTTITVGNKKFFWNSRAHRKMRYAKAEVETGIHHPSKVKHRFHFCSCEPTIVTWYICYIGIISSVLSVLSDFYATFPEFVANSDPDMASYIIGIVSTWLWFLTGYLIYVESINHTYSMVRLPTTQSRKIRKFINPVVKFGHWRNPLNATDLSAVVLAFLIEIGYPLEEEVELKKSLISAQNKDVANQNETTTTEGNNTRISSNGYRWYSFKPELKHMGIFNAIIYLISTTIYSIAFSASYPSTRHNVTNVSFLVDFLFTIAAIGFIFYGHVAMAEASGSWIIPKFINIGWFISMFNAIGGYCYLVSALLLLAYNSNDDAMDWWSLLSTFLGSCSFLIAGILQCIEFSSEHPIFIPQGR